MLLKVLRALRRRARRSEPKAQERLPDTERGLVVSQCLIVRDGGIRRLECDPDRDHRDWFGGAD